jgi:hypothetical protein
MVSSLLTSTGIPTRSIEGENTKKEREPIELSDEPFVYIANHFIIAESS